MNLSAVIDELVKEKSLKQEILIEIIRDGVLAACQRGYPYLDFKILYNSKNGELEINTLKKIVSGVENKDTEISTWQAKKIKKEATLGDKLWIPFEGQISRINIITAKNIISEKIKKLETEAIYKEFKDKENTVVYGYIHRCEKSGAIVKLQNVYAFLPRSLSIPENKCIVGLPIRALLKEVLLEANVENQLILDRVSPDFLKRLFELEIPEVFERIVEVKKIVRSPGYKSKVIVFSNDSNIDPVGTCVGVGGSRIKPILKELGGEKIDILTFSTSTEDIVRAALKPAEINRIEILSEGKDDYAKVWLDEDQRSFAIGKQGQNISLASKLVGMRIELVQGNSGSFSKDDQNIMENIANNLFSSERLDEDENKEKVLKNTDDK